MTSPGTGPPSFCGSCANDLRARARFCDLCGSPASTPDPAGERKHVTVLFADVVGSMRLAAALDPERLRAIMHEFFNRAAAVVQRYQGTVDKFTGDGLMALFGAPAALEDHALRACIAALEMQGGARKLAAELGRRDGVTLEIRIGLNSGEVVAGDIGTGPGRYTAVGHSVGMAQRMEAAAPAGGVLCSPSTAYLVSDAAALGPVQEVAVKGSDSGARAHLLLSVESDRIMLGRNEGRLLGRDEELRALDTALDAERGGLITIVGEPGLGKSRLITEVSARASQRGADIVLARCESHTTGVAFRALARLLRTMFGVQGLGLADARARTAAQLSSTADDADIYVLYDAMGIADPAAADIGMSVDGRRRKLVALMVDAVQRRSRRVLFVLEDAHWIDAPSDDVLADFAASLAATSALMIVSYRPEFTGALDTATTRRLELRALTRSAAMHLVSQVLGEDPSVTRLGGRIADAAAGNPFFIEEIIRDLAGRDVLEGSRGGYRLTARFDAITVPPTVQAVLAARIDRLPARTKSVLNAAAVIGLHFDDDTLLILLPDTEPSHLAELVAVELIDQTEFVPAQRYCFRHPLVRAVAYESQLNATRATAHRALAAAIQRRTPTGEEGAALIATHLEAAGDLLEAYHWHMRAAAWLRPRDLAAAREQWESARRVADRLPADLEETSRLRIAPRAMLSSTTLYLRDDLPTDVIYDELYALATRAGDMPALAIGMAGRIFSFCVNEIRVPDAAALADELDVMTASLRCEPATRGIVGNALAFARLANGELAASLRACDDILAAHDVPVTERAPALALRGFVDICLGNAPRGRRDLSAGTQLARRLHPVNYASVQLYSAVMAALGILDAAALLDDKRRALHRAEAFGDICGIVIAQWSYGTVLLRAGGKEDEALATLELARANSQRYGIGACSLGTIIPDLARAAARTGRLDAAIADLRVSFEGYWSGFPVFAGFSAEALVDLLIERRGAADLAEARLLLDRWESRLDGAPGLVLWVPRARALLAAAQGDRDACHRQARRYLRACEEIGAHGRLNEARRLATGSASVPVG